MKINSGEVVTQEVSIKFFHLKYCNPVGIRLIERICKMDICDKNICVICDCVGTNPK